MKENWETATNGPSSMEQNEGGTGIYLWGCGLLLVVGGGGGGGVGVGGGGGLLGGEVQTSQKKLTPPMRNLIKGEGGYATKSFSN